MKRRIRYLTATLLAVFLCLMMMPTALASEQLSDEELLARLVWLEARGEPDEGQRAVVFVVMNRLADGRWGDTLYSVIFAPHQFSPAHAIPRTTPTEKEYANVQLALAAAAGGLQPIPPWVMFFRADYDHDWDGYLHHSTIGGHCFGGFRCDKRRAEDVQSLYQEADDKIAVILGTPPISPLDTDNEE